MDDDWLLMLGVAVAVGVAIGASLLWLAFSESFPQPSPRYTTVTNIEEWELVEDEAGNLKKIVVHRRVERG